MAELSAIELCEANNVDPDIIDYITSFNNKEVIINGDNKGSSYIDANNHNDDDSGNTTDENIYQVLIPPPSHAEKQNQFDQKTNNTNCKGKETVNDVSFTSIQTRNRKSRKEKDEGDSIFDFNEENKDHLRVESCKICSYTTASKFLMEKHMIKHQVNHPFSCQHCEKQFKTLSALNIHMDKHLGNKKYRCKECVSRFTNTGELKRHTMYMHTYEKPFRCSICSYSCVERAKLRRHIRSHTGERPYPCPHCSYASADTFKLKRHLRVHTGEKPYKCDICSLQFTQSNSLKSHRLLHSSDRPIFQCELCPSTCTRQSDLKNHVLKIHTSNNPILCRKCGKNFPDRYTYKIHCRTHANQKCFQCELCNFVTNFPGAFQSHMFTHTGEKPFKCSDCENAFRTSTQLRYHLINFHNINTSAKSLLQCRYCNRIFISVGFFERHMRKLHKEKINDNDMEEYINKDPNFKPTTYVKELKKREKKLKKLKQDSNINLQPNSIPRKRGRPRKLPVLIPEIKKELRDDEETRMFAETNDHVSCSNADNTADTVSEDQVNANNLENFLILVSNLSNNNECNSHFDNLNTPVISDNNKIHQSEVDNLTTENNSDESTGPAEDNGENRQDSVSQMLQFNNISVDTDETLKMNSNHVNENSNQLNEPLSMCS